MYLNKRKKIYYVWFRDEHGKVHKVSTRTSVKSEAQIFLKNFKSDRNRSVNQAVFKKLSEFLPEYIQFSQIHHTVKTTRTCLSSFRELIRVVGNLPLTEIDSRTMEYFLGVKSKECSVHSIARYYRTLRSIFEQAHKWKYISENPLSTVTKPKTPSVELKFFSKDDFNKLIGVIPESSIIKQMAYFGVLTGCRLSEVLYAEWKYVNFERRVYVVTCNNTFQTKNKQNRALPLNEFLYNMLNKMRESDPTGNYIFHKPDNTPYAAEYVSGKFKRYCRRAGLGHLSFHSLRKSFGSWLLMSDVPIFTISKLLGHSSVSVTTAHYATLYTDQLHDVVNKLTIGDLSQKK